MLQLATSNHPVSLARVSQNARNVREHYRKVETVVAAALRVPVKDLRAATRGPACVAFARQTAMYLAHTTLGFSLSAVACAAQRDRTTVAHACRLLEQRRDEPVVEAMLGRLEAAIAPLAGASGERSR